MPKHAHRSITSPPAVICARSQNMAASRHILLAVAAAVLLTCSVCEASRAVQQYAIPGYNSPPDGDAPSGARQLQSWHQKHNDKALARVYRSTHTNLFSSAEKVVNYVEWGSNDGSWMAARMREAREKGTKARCFTFEPLPRYRPNHEALVKEFGCEFYPTVVWTHEKQFKLSVGVATGAGSSVMSDSRIDPYTDEDVRITAVDGPAWLMKKFRPTDYIYMRVDIEGAEYSVVRDMILRGVGCWVDEMELEFHATHHEQNYNKRAADVVLPWMLRSCGVDVKTEAYYPGHLWKADDVHCRECDMLLKDMPLDP